MMKPSLSPLLLPLILLCASPQAFGTDDPLSCADRSITASAVRTPEDARVFVQCAYEFVQEVGFAEAYRAFHEDERWRSGPIYISVDEVTSMAGTAVGLVFPPDPSTDKDTGLLGTADRCLRQRLVQGAASPHEQLWRGLDVLLVHESGDRPG